MNKIPNYKKYITTSEFNKLKEENFAARLRHVNLISKTDFDNKLTNFNRKVTWNKTNYTEVRKKLNSLITNDSNFS